MVQHCVRSNKWINTLTSQPHRPIQAHAHAECRPVYCASRHARRPTIQNVAHAQILLLGIGIPLRFFSVLSFSCLCTEQASLFSRGASADRPRRCLSLVFLSSLSAHNRYTTANHTSSSVCLLCSRLLLALVTPEDRLGQRHVVCCTIGSRGSAAETSADCTELAAKALCHMKAPLSLHYLCFSKLLGNGK